MKRFLFHISGNKKATIWLVLGGYFCLTVIYTFPLILHFTDQVIGTWKGDNLEFVWKIWWVAHSIFDLGQSPLYLTNINYPYGFAFANGDITLLNTLFLSPITQLFGPVFTYNLSIFVSFVLTGFFTYLWVERLTDNRLAAFFAGFLFSFCNFRMARVGVHFSLMGTQWIVLFLYFVEKFIHDLSRRNAVYVGLAFVLAGLSTVYYAAMLILLTPPYVAIRLFKNYGFEGLKKNWRSILGGAIVFLAISLLVLLPATYPYIEIRQSGNAIIPFDDIVFWSADISNYLTPNPYQFVWKDWIVEHIPVVVSRGSFLNEYVVGLSFIGMLFALFGWMTARKDERTGWGWWMTSTFFLSLGPVMKIFNRLVTINVSSEIYQKFSSIVAWLGEHSFAHEILHLGSINQIFIPLPVLFVRWFIPGFLSMRSWGRFSVFLMVGVAVWAGYGLRNYILVETKHFQIPLSLKSKIFLGILFIAALFETYNGPQPLVTPGPRQVDSWLAVHDVQKPIIQMPILSALSGPQLYYSQFHYHPIAGGYGTYFDFIFSQEYPELKNFPSDSSLDLLRDWGKDKDPSIEGVKYILLDEAEVSASDPLWEAIKNQTRLEEITVLDGVHVYSIRN